MSTTAAQKIMSVRGEFLPDKTKGLYCQDEFLKNIFNLNKQPENQDFPVIEYLY